MNMQPSASRHECPQAKRSCAVDMPQEVCCWSPGGGFMWACSLGNKSNTLALILGHFHSTILNISVAIQIIISCPCLYTISAATMYNCPGCICVFITTERPNQINERFRLLILCTTQNMHILQRQSQCCQCSILHSRPSKAGLESCCWPTRTDNNNAQLDSQTRLVNKFVNPEKATCEAQHHVTWPKQGSWLAIPSL